MRLKCNGNAALIDKNNWRKAGLVKAIILFTLVFPQFAGAHDVDGDHHEGLAEAIHALQVVAGQTPSSSDPTGNAQPGQVLEGVTFSNVNELGLTGTMPDNGTLTITPGLNDQSIPEGYHSGAGVVPGAKDLLSNNIKSGITLFDVAGDPMVVDTSAGDAVADDIKVDRKVFVDGAMVTGTNHGPWGCTDEGNWNYTYCIFHCVQKGNITLTTCQFACRAIETNASAKEILEKQCF